jgi:ATP-binding cassette, subfamily F, member 3
LNDYSGSLILVSHDAFLVERLVDRLLIVKNGGVSEFVGDIHEYRDLVLNKNQKKTNKNNNIKTNSSKNIKTTSSVSDLKKLLSESEKKIHDYEKKKSFLEKEMLDDQFYDTKNNSRIIEANIDLKKVLQVLSQEEKIWEKIAEDIENIDK